MSNAIYFKRSDGGRADAGFRGDTGDCVTRAIAIATGIDYRTVYDELFARAGSTPRRGVQRKVYESYLFDLGWMWEPTMRIGSGCTVHLRSDEIPDVGPIIVRLSGHIAAVKSGVLHDTHDCSREGTRCVYGIYSPGMEAVRS